MNCATHNDVEAVAYCRTCGKALCQTCVRSVRGVIYCENCLEARLEGVQPQPAAPAPGFVPPAQAAYVASPPSTPGSGPNPGLAGVLAGLFPFGVGAVYCGQYAKGLAHMLIFAGLIWGVSSSNNDNIAPVLGLGIGFFYIYQIIDAVRSARALQSGQPAPDPFGLGRTFSAGHSVDTSKIPTGAMVLIGLGLLFSLETMGFHFFSFGRLWPFILVGIGAWLFAVRWGYVGGGKVYDCDRCRARGLMGPAVLVTIGTLFLLEQFDAVGFHRTWPLLLVVIGLVKVLQGNASTVGHVETQMPPAGPGTPGGPGMPAGQVQPPMSEVKNG